MNTEQVAPIQDPVGLDTAGAGEIGFSVPERYNASAVLFDNLEAGRGARTAVLSGDVRLTYAGLCALASRPVMH